MVIERHYACVDASGFIRQSRKRMEEDGVEYPALVGPYTYALLAAPLDWAPTTPTKCYKWEGGTPILVETAVLADVKAIKNTEINAARLSANRSTFPFAGKDIACDELSRSDIDAVNGIVSLTGALPPDWAGFWKATDNSYVAVGDLAAWTNFYVAMVTKGSSNFAHAQALKAQLTAATTFEEVGAISWN